MEIQRFGVLIPLVIAYFAPLTITQLSKWELQQAGSDELRSSRSSLCCHKVGTSQTVCLVSSCRPESDVDTSEARPLGCRVPLCSPCFSFYNISQQEKFSWFLITLCADKHCEAKPDGKLAASFKY